MDFYLQMLSPGVWGSQNFTPAQGTFQIQIYDKNNFKCF